MMLHAWVVECVNHESKMGLGKASLVELERYLREFNNYCQDRLKAITDLSAGFLKDYVDYRCENRGPAVVKAVVWSLRKFGAFLSLRQILPENPANPLQHPKFPLRKELPIYLSVNDLRKLLTVAAEKNTVRDFAVISLITGTGLRPGDIARTKRVDFDPKCQCITGVVKGYWTKTTPLNAALTAVLKDYLSARTDDCDSLFVTDRGKPVTVSWIQRMVKMAGHDAGLKLPLTCNMLRHSFATHTADRHGKVITRSLLGHQHARTTSVYTHLSPRRYKTLMNRHPYAIVIRVTGRTR